MGLDLNKSISELEGWKWKGAIPGEDDSYVVKHYFSLHAKPIAEMNLSDIRFLIGQNVGLKYLVPIALDSLRKELFIETEYYPGDLFYSLLSINNEPNFWSLNSDLKGDLISIYNEQKKIIGSLDVSEEDITKIKQAYKEFLTRV
jgi:hypothetical protein